MKRYRFEVRQELITPIVVLADSEREARERVFHLDDQIIPFDTVCGDLRLDLRSVSDE